MSGNDVVLAGQSAQLQCVTDDSASPHYWHYYSLTPGARPCGFDQASLYPGIPLCPTYPRIRVEVAYLWTTSTPFNATMLIIGDARLSDAGTYTCGEQNPNNIHRSHAVILGVFGKFMCKLHMHIDSLNS